MKHETDKEIIEAIRFIKDQHNGELPYKFGTTECANMMAKYLANKKEEIFNAGRERIKHPDFDLIKVIVKYTEKGKDGLNRDIRYVKEENFEGMVGDILKSIKE